MPVLMTMTEIFNRMPLIEESEAAGFADSAGECNHGASHTRLRANESLTRGSCQVAICRDEKMEQHLEALGLPPSNPAAAPRHICGP